jgi:hypothetical protein
MSQSASRADRSIAIIAAVVLIGLALVYAGMTALFAFLLSQPRNTIFRIGETRLYSEFGAYGLVIFGLLCLLSAYAGLATIRRWPHWASIGQAAGWATIGLCVYGIWIFLNLIMPGLPYFPIPLGINLPVDVALAAGVIGVFVLWATRMQAEKNP